MTRAACTGLGAWFLRTASAEPCVGPQRARIQQRSNQLKPQFLLTREPASVILPLTSSVIIWSLWYGSRLTWSRTAVNREGDVTLGFRPILLESFLQIRARGIAGQFFDCIQKLPLCIHHVSKPRVRKTHDRFPFQTPFKGFATRERAGYGTRLVPPEDAAGCIRFCLQRTARHPWLLAAHQRRSRSLAAATVHIPETTFYELFFLQTASVMGIRFGLSGAQGRACETKALHDIPTGERLLPSNCTRSPQSRNICYHDGS